MKRRKTDNPLSQARGKQQRPENIWFRRSGAGYQLFVEYYAGQPPGTVVDFPNEILTAATANNAVTHKSTPVLSKATTGLGLSRASKRRKKRKNKSGGDASDGKPPQVPQQRTATKEEAVPVRPDEEIHKTSPLLQVLGQKKKFSHLLPFLEALSRPLPLTFRLRQPSSLNQKEIQKTLAKDFSHVVAPLSFDDNIYQASGSLQLSKRSLATTCPALKAFLVQHSQNGTLARQEIGSILPVLALQRAGYLKSHSRVLDMCASPGSKTLQALEIIGTSGQVLANDVSKHRLAALQEAVDRSGLPLALTQRVRYTQQDARRLVTQKQDWKVIICDVPCSGDGTCRKDKHVLPTWKPNIGNQLHATQVEILVRALELLRVGGIVCYSTCSLNPVEDEAVVAEALRKTRTADTAMELVQWPHLPGFVRRSGVQKWRVADYAENDADETTQDEEQSGEDVRVRWHETWQDAVNMDNPLKSLWPPEDSDELHLERCTRLWPQDHDSGGFFLALIKKTATKH